jgi:hypothetical protein
MSLEAFFVFANHQTRGGKDVSVEFKLSRTTPEVALYNCKKVKAQTKWMNASSVTVNKNSFLSF